MIFYCSRGCAGMPLHWHCGCQAAVQLPATVCACGLAMGQEMRVVPERPSRQSKWAAINAYLDRYEEAS